MNTLLKKLFTLTTFSLALLPAQNAVHAQCKNSIDENIYKELPFNMPKVEQPSFPDYTVSILQFGAKSDGTTLNTKAINDAIKAVNAKGGGKVVIPEGLWLTGPIELLSNVNLHTFTLDDIEQYGAQPRTDFIPFLVCFDTFGIIEVLAGQCSL